MTDRVNSPMVVQPEEDIMDKIINLLDGCGPFWNRIYVIVKGFPTVVDGETFPHFLKYTLLNEYIIRNVTSLENLDAQIVDIVTLVLESILIQLIDFNNKKIPHNDVAETVLKRISGVNSTYANVLLNTVAIVWEQYANFLEFPDQHLMVQAESVDDEKIDPLDFQILQEAIESSACIYRNRFISCDSKMIVNDYFTIFPSPPRPPSPPDEFSMPLPRFRGGMRIPAPRWIIRLLLFMATIFSPNRVGKEYLGFPNRKCKITTFEEFKSYFNYPSVRYTMLASKALGL